MPSNGVIHKHLSLLRPQPHSVIDTTDTSDASTTHREGLCVCVHVSACMCAIVCMYVYTCTSTERYMYDWWMQSEYRRGTKFPKQK